MKPRVTVYTKPDCGLCDKLKEAIAASGCLPFIDLREIDILQDSALFEEYKHEIPVVEIEGREVARHRITPEEFRGWLERAARLRPATNADAKEVRALIFSVLREYGLTPDPEGTDRDLDDIEANYLPDGLFDVLVEDGRIIGTVGVYPKGEGVCELRKMYLERNARGRGLGRRMLEHACARARELGFRSMELETAGALKEAISLYIAWGFRPVERHLAKRCDRAFAKEL